jgi:hypothetical protein
MLCGDKVMDLRLGRTTERVSLPVMVPFVAVMVAAPGELAVAKPLGFTVITPLGVVDHVTRPERS